MRIAASNTASDDVTKVLVYTLFNTDLWYSCGHNVVVIL